MVNLTIPHNLRKLIEDHGSISFAHFMTEAMSNDLYGYYATKNPIGKEGDFITAPEISQVFGELVGIWCASIWDSLGKPEQIQLLELGPGKGTLMKDLLRATAHIDGFHQALSIRMIESSATLSQKQQLLLSDHAIMQISWHSSITDDIPKIPTLIVANEFFDALPVQQYIKVKDKWHERRVSIFKGSEEFCFIQMPIDELLSESLNQDYPNAAEQAIVEISSASLEIIKKISDLLNEVGGAALIFDYGYDYDYSTRTNYHSTIQGVKNHHFHPVLHDVGNVDITYHVDFWGLKKAAEIRGVNVFGTITQRDFLLKMGLELRQNQLVSDAKNQSQKEEILSGINRLISPEEMGHLFKVMGISSNGLAAVFPYSSR